MKRIFCVHAVALAPSVRRLLLLYGIVLCAASLWAQRTGDVRFRQLDMSDGLPAYGVRSLAQDEDGFIWIGTDKGLCRYDGIRVQIISSADPAWDHPYVTALAITRDNVWVGTDNGVWRLDRRTERLAPLEGVNGKGYVVSKISVGQADSAVWISTHQRGIFSYQPRTRQLQHYAMHEAGGNMDYVYCDREGNVWALSSVCAQPLWRLSRATRQFVPLRLAASPSLPSGGSLCMLEAADGKIYIGSYHLGLLRLEANGQLTSLFAPQMDGAGDLLDALAEKRDGILLMATGSGLFAFDPRSGETERIPMSYNDEGSGTRFLHSLLVDEEGGIWCGTFYGGVTYLSPLNERFRNETSHTPHANGLRLQGNVVEAFSEDPDGRVWVGTDDGGLSLYDPVAREFLDFPMRGFFKEKNIHALLCEGDWLWVGTYTDGIYHLNTRTGQLRHYTTAEGLPDNSCYAICRDRQGRLWVATFASAALFSLTMQDGQQNGESIGRFRAVQRIGAPAANILQDHAGNMWFATQGNGLWRYAPDSRQWKAYQRGKGLATDMVNGLALDSKSCLWVSTDRGLVRYDERSRRFVPFSAQRKLPSDDVSQLVSDGETFWISTANGLAKLYASDSLHIFNKDDGLPGNQFLPAAGIITTDGQLFFGTTDGFCAFRPSSIRINKQPPRVFITGLSVLGRSLEVGDDLLPQAPSRTAEITLPHDAASFVIHFAALSYAAPQKNEYFYALEGYDSIWHEPIGTPCATYSDLAPGTYVFHARATNNDGVLSLNEARLRIVVRQPWWWTPAARVAYLAVLLLAALLFVALHRRKRLNRARKVAAVDKDLLTKLNELIGENLTNPQLSVNFLAEQLGMSRTALFSKLKLVTAVTPNEMIQQTRLNRAAQLLRDGNVSVTEVCQSIGMSSPSYFSKCFQRYFGCKPSEYAKAQVLPPL